MCDYVTEPRRRITRGPRKADLALWGGASQMGFSVAFLDRADLPEQQAPDSLAAMRYFSADHLAGDRRRQGESYRPNRQVKSDATQNHQKRNRQVNREYPG